jgi:hypothetical protein
LMATTNYGWTLPTVGGSDDTWGDENNTLWTDLDTLLGGVNATEFSILDGATVSTAELNYLNGVTSGVQSQINGKADTSHTHTLANITDAGTAAGNDTGDFATAAQGALADTSVQPGDTQTEATWETGTSTAESLVSPAKIKAAIDANAQAWTSVGPTATTSGSTVDFTSIPSGTNFIRVLMYGVSLTGSDDFLLQIGTSGTPETSGYVAISERFTNAASSTSGFVIDLFSASNVVSGFWELVREPGTNKWVASFTGIEHGASRGRVSSGVLELGGALDVVRLTTVSSNFDAGTASIFYQ